MKLVDVDNSDMQQWASSLMAQNFLREVSEWRQAADRRVHTKLCAKSAGEYEAYDSIIRLIEGLAR